MNRILFSARKCAAVIIILWSISAAAQAEAADESPLMRPRSVAPQPLEQTVSATAWGIAGYHLGLGLGARMTLPAADGLLREGGITDVFAVDVGADYLRFRDDNALANPSSTWGSILRPIAGVLWAFRFGERLALYPKLEVGWNVPRSSAREPEMTARYAGLHVEGIAGLLISLGRVSLRAESGWGYLKAGVGFSI